MQERNKRTSNPSVDLESSNRPILKVVEWAYIEEKFWKNEAGKISKSEPRHRICYEYADHGDLWDLIAWYHTQRYYPCP